MAAAVEEAVAAAEEEAAEEEGADRGVMATTCPKARSRPGRGPGPARPLRAMPT